MWNEIILSNVKLCGNLKQVYVSANIAVSPVSPVLATSLTNASKRIAVSREVRQSCGGNCDRIENGDAYFAYNILAPISKLDNLVGIEFEEKIDAAMLLQFLQNKAYFGNLNKMKEINIIVKYSDKSKDCYPKISKLLNQTQVNNCIGFDLQTPTKYINQCLANLPKLRKLKCRLFETTDDGNTTESEDEDEDEDENENENEKKSRDRIDGAIYDASVLESVSKHCRSIEYFEGMFNIDTIYNCSQMIHQFSQIFQNCKSLIDCKLYFSASCDQRNIIVLYKALEAAQTALKKRFPFELHISKENVTDSIALVTIRMRFWKNIQRIVRLIHCKNINNGEKINIGQLSELSELSELAELNDKMCRLTLDTMKNKK